LFHPKLVKDWDACSILFAAFKTGALATAPDYGPVFGVGLNRSGEVKLFARDAAANFDSIYVFLKPPSSKPFTNREVVDVDCGEACRSPPRAASSPFSRVRGVDPEGLLRVETSRTLLSSWWALRANVA
jgi:hypothetical protein